MARRGGELREHILWTAKSVFLEMGFERTSMDVIAARAETSKRTLYAHFESKERLYLAMIELVRGLFFGKLRSPGDYAAEPDEALTIFCGRYLEFLLYEPNIQMCRVSLAEVARFPEGARQYFDVIFPEVERRLAEYLQQRFALPAQGAERAAQRLLGQVIHPRFEQALFGVGPLVQHFNERALGADFDLGPVRDAVAELLAGLPAQQR